MLNNCLVHPWPRQAHVFRMVWVSFVYHFPRLALVGEVSADTLGARAALSSCLAMRGGATHYLPCGSNPPHLFRHELYWAA